MIALLNALYNDQQPLPEQHWGQLMQDMELFSMQAQLYHLLQQNVRHKESVPEHVMKRLRSEHDKVIVQNLMLQHTERQILSLFDQQKIAAMPLKGTRFAQRFFGSLAARATSDVDLLVQPSNLESAIKLVQGLGFKLDKKVHNHAVLYRLITPQIPLMIELHWTMDKPHLSDLQDAPFWTTAIPMNGYDGVLELDSISTFYFMILHGMRHRMDSPRYLLDLAQMIFCHGSEIDYDMLAARAQQDRTFRRVQAALSIVYNQFPVLHERKPLPFPLLETYWTYEAVRDRKLGKRGLNDYKNRMFFRFGIFDTWKHQIMAQQPVYKRLSKRHSESSTKEIPYG
ncbi:nucleotidyltransferase family protein [Paenibacillus daejeonensis]|uniref:nucleotidyltransferase family protein n=1 Tax=Paenibacillus daejeonensis TaxID=135193 RepID=UPI00036E7335|nr:nucleotidyltransferase family protein [Paenibacillus daejeonensis]